MKAFQLVISAAVVALPVTLLTWAQRSHAQGEAASLRGSWIVTVTPNALFLCGGPQIAPPGSSFTELATYEAGGTLIETNTILNANSATLIPGLPFNASDGHGAWKAQGPEFRASFRKLVFDTAGAYVANADISETGPLPGPNTNDFGGSFSIMFSFLNGNPAVCGSGTLVAQRIAADQ